MLVEDCSRPSIRYLKTIASVSNTAVRSFPRLCERSSTAGWQHAPLVDLDDSVAGRPVNIVIQIGQENYFAGSWYDWSGPSDVGMKNEVFTKRRVNSHLCAPARLARRGAFGSYLGASSHRRFFLALSRRGRRERGERGGRASLFWFWAGLGEIRCGCCGVVESS